MSTPICRVWDAEQGKYVGLPAIKGGKGDPGAPGKDGSDATVTAASITGALGYKPAAPSDIQVVPTAEQPVLLL